MRSTSISTPSGSPLSPAMSVFENEWRSDSGDETRKGLLCFVITSEQGNATSPKHFHAPITTHLPCSSPPALTLLWTQNTPHLHTASTVVLSSSSSFLLSTYRSCMRPRARDEIFLSLYLRQTVLEAASNIILFSSSVSLNTENSRHIDRSLHSTARIHRAMRIWIVLGVLGMSTGLALITYYRSVTPTAVTHYGHTAQSNWRLASLVGMKIPFARFLCTTVTEHLESPQISPPHPCLNADKQIRQYLHQWHQHLPMKLERTAVSH